MPADVIRRRFTVDEYECMGRAGILREDERVELIDGEIIEMSPINVRHTASVKRLNRRFSRQAGDRAIVSVQDPIQLSSGAQPQPDIVLLRYRADFYAGGHPRPEDVLLLIEVADSSLAYDREVKAPPYATAGIEELWIVNLTDGVAEVYRDPLEGAHRAVSRHERGSSVSALAFPEITITVAEILG